MDEFLYRCPQYLMTSRRNLLKTLTLAPLAFSAAPVLGKSLEKKEAKFIFSLNTSTIRGQKLALPEMIEIAARAGYDGIEPWIMEIDAYLKSGKTLQSLKKHLTDAGIIAVDAIGFAPWMAQDVEKSKGGFDQMEKEMGMLAELGCQRIAAPAIGTENPIDLLIAGEKYAQLLNLGRKTGVMPQLEFWGAFPQFHHLGQAMAVAAAANDPDVKILADIYHLFRGGSGFEGLHMLDGNVIDIFHLNDFTDQIPRLDQQDKDRVFPGDGVAPLHAVANIFKAMGGTKILSLELFNPTYYEMDAFLVAKTGLEKMKQFF
jgi:sugar phosphate isomerase/epimerase